MRGIRILIIFLINFSMLFSTEKYIPKNRQEIEYLEKIREKTFKMGIVQKNYFASEKIDGISLNDIIEEMFRDYLDLNIILEKREWDENHSKFKNGDLDIVGYLTPSEDRKNYALFTQGIIEENLVIVSRDKKIDTIMVGSFVKQFLLKPKQFFCTQKLIIQKLHLE